jgi:hypothetical protein
MVTRSEKYKEDNNTNNTYMSRTRKNQALYNKMSEEELENFDVDSNTFILESNKDTIDIDKLKDMLDKKYREPEKKVSLLRNDEEVINNQINLDETREYDINEVLNKAKENNVSDYEEKRYQKIRNTSVDILNGLDIKDNMDDDEDDEIKEKNDKKNSVKLQELIDTITLKEEEISGGSDPLDILTDLKGDDDATRVLGAKDDFSITITKEAPTVKTYDVEDTDEDKKNDIELTTTNLFTESDFDDFNDLKSEVASNKIVLKILIFIIILLFLGGLVFILNRVLGLNLF